MHLCMCACVKSSSGVHQNKNRIFVGYLRLGGRKK